MTTDRIHRDERGAFTLIEILVVLVIIAMMIGLIAAMARPPTAASARSGMRQLEGLVAEARAEALSRNITIRLGFVSAGGGDKYRQRSALTLAYDEVNSVWVQRDAPNFFVDGVFLDPTTTTGLVSQTFDLAGQSVTLLCADFQPNGFCAQQGAEITIASGRAAGDGSAPDLDPDIRGGVRLTRIGTSPEIP